MLNSKIEVGMKEMLITTLKAYIEAHEGKVDTMTRICVHGCRCHLKKAREELEVLKKK